MRVFTADMKLRGREDLIEQVKAQQADIVLLIVGNTYSESPTLGYVDATHQTLRTHADRTVWTFYWALTEGTPAQNRQELSTETGITGRKGYCATSNACIATFDNAYPESTLCAWGTPWPAPRSERFFHPSDNP